MSTSLRDDPGFALSPALVRQRFGRAAARLSESTYLYDLVAQRMDERLDYIKIAPQRILDLGSGLGRDHGLLHKRYPKAQLIAVDFAEALLHVAQPRPGLLGRWLARTTSNPAQAVCARANALPLAHNSVSLVWSNLMFPWLDDPTPTLQEIHRVLAVEGLLMFSSFGPDTLKELRAAFADSPYEHVHQFIDMHDVGDALVNAGFSDPVMDMDMLTITYSSVSDLFRDLRAAAATNASVRRAPGLLGRERWQRAQARLEAMRRDDKLPVTIELIQGHAWKAAPKQLADGRAVIQFQPRRK